MSIQFVFADENPAVITALAEAFGGRGGPEVHFVVGNVFCQGPGVLISPANSRGDMGGGFDLQLRLRFGADLETQLQFAIKNDFGGRLPIGKALWLATGHADYPFVVFAPAIGSHMGIVKHPADIRKAAAAAFLIALEPGARTGDPPRQPAGSSFRASGLAWEVWIL